LHIDLIKDWVYKKKIVDKCSNNTLLFHTIENGQRIFNKLKEEMPEKSFTIDGEEGKKREIIKTDGGYRW
jgi:hypothetical protein